MQSSKVHERWPSGKRIEAWWPLDKCWYRATVLQSVACTKKQLVLYEDGDAEELILIEQEQQGLIRTAPDAQHDLRQNLVAVQKHLALKLANERWHFCTRCDQTLENEHFPCPCNQPISLLSDDEEEESSQTLMWGGQILRAEAPLATDRRQCHGCFVSGGVQLEASACPNCGIDLTPRRTRTGHLMSPQIASSAASGVTSAHVHKASPSDTHPRPLTKATAKKDVEKRTYSEGRSGPFVCTGRFRPEARSVARGTFAGVSRGIKKEVEEVEITKTWVVGGAFGGVARSVKKEATERARIGTVPEKCRRFQSTGQVSGKEYEPTGEAVTVRMPQKVVRVGTGETEGSSAHIDSGKEARGIERVEVSKRGQAGEGVCSKEKRVVTLQELLKATATGAPTCSEAASAALPLSNDSAPANLSPGLEGSSPNPSLNPSDTPQKASAAANLDESSPLSAFDAGHFVDGLLPADAAQSLSRNGSLVPERSAGGPVTDNCLDRDASDAGAGSERVANPETSGIAGASDRKSFAGQARAYAFPDLQDGDGSTGLERSPRLEGSNTGVGPIRLVGALALDAGTILAAGAETTDGARSGGGADLVAEAVKDDEGDSDTRGKAASRADQVAGAVSNSGAMENAEAIMDCGAASDATTVSDASCLSFASAQQNWEAGGLSPPLIRDEAQECTPKPEKPSVTPSPQYAPETPSPTPAACLDGASAVKSLKRGSELAVLDSQTLLEAPAENGLLIPGDQNHEAGDSDVPASVSGQGGSQVSGEPCPSEGTGGDDGRRASARLAGGGPKSTSLTQGLGYLAGPLAALSGLGWAPWGGESEVQFLGTTEEVKEKVRSSVGERGPNFAPQDPPEPGRTRRLWQSLKRQFSTAAKPGTPASGKPAAICDPKSSVKPLVGGPWRATFDTRSDFSLPSDWVCDVTSPSGADVTPRSQIRKPVGRRAVRESPGAGAEADRTERRTEPEHGGKKPDGAASPEETGVVLGQRPSETGTEKERAAERGESAGVKEVPPEPVASWPAAGAEALGPKREPELDSLRKVKTKSAEAVGFANQEAGTAAGQADDDAEGVSDDMLAAALGDVEQLIADHEQASDEFAFASPPISPQYDSPPSRSPATEALPELRLKRKRSSALRKPPRGSPETPAKPPRGSPASPANDEEGSKILSPQWQDGRNAGLLSPDGSVCRGRIKRMPDVYRASASLEFRVEDQVGLKSPPGEEATSKKKKRKGAPKCSSEEARVGAASGEHPGKVTPERGETKAVSGGNGKGAVSSEHGKLSVLEQTETVGLQNRARGCDGDGAVSNTPTEEMGRLGAIGGPGLTGESSSGLEDGARLEGRGSGRVGIASGGRLDGGPADVTASGGRLEGGPADVVNTATRGSGIKPRTKRKRAAGVGVSVPEGLGGRPNRDIAAGGLKEEYGGLERGLWEGLLRGLKEEEGEIAGSTRDVSEAAGVGRRGETCSLVEESPEEIERPHPDVGTLDKHKHIAEKFQWERNISPGNGEEEGVSEESGGMEWGQRRKRARGPNVAADLDGLSGRSKVDGMLELPAASLEAGQKLGRFGDSGAESADAALSTSAEDSAVEERREEKGDGNVGAEEQEKREQGGQGKEEKQSDPEEKERGAETKTGEEERKELGGGNGEKTEGCRGKAEKKEGSASDSRLSGVDDVDWEEAFLSLKPLSPPLSPFQLRLAQSPGPQPEGSPYKFLRTPEVVHPPQPDSGPVPPDCGVSGAGGDVMLTSPEGGALALPRLVEKLPSPVACQTVPAGSPLVGARNPQTVPPSNSPSLSLLDGPLSVAPPQTFTNPLESLPATDSIGGVQNPESASEEAPESPRVSPVQAADLLSTPPRNQGVPSAQKTPPRSCQTSTCPVDPALGPTPESKHKRRRMSLSPAVKKRLVSLASPLSQNGADDSDPFSNPRGSPYFARKRRSETQVNGNMVGDARLLKHRPEEGSVSGGFERGASKSDLSFPGGQQRWGTEGEEGERQFSQKKRAKFNLWLDEGTPTKGALAESPLGLSGRVGVGRNGEIGTDGGLEGSNPGGGEPLEAHSLGANSLGARNSSGAVLKDRSDLDCGPTERGKSELRVTEQVEGGGSLGTGTPGVERWLMLPEGTGFDAEARARGDEPGAGRQLETRAEVPGGSAQSGVDRLRENLSRTLERVGVKMAKADGECGAQRGSQDGQGQQAPVRLGLPSGSRTRLLPGLHPESLDCDSPALKGPSEPLSGSPNDPKSVRGIGPKPGRPFSLRISKSEAQSSKTQTGDVTRSANAGVSRGSDGGPQPVKLSRSLRLLQAAKDIADKRAEAEKRAADNPNPSPVTRPPTLLSQKRSLGEFDWSDSPVGFRGIGERAREISARERDISGREKGIRGRPSLDEVTRENTRLNSFRLHFPPLPPVVRKKKRRRFVMRMRTAPCNPPANEALNPSSNEGKPVTSDGQNPSGPGVNDIAEGVASAGVSPPGEWIDTSPNSEPAVSGCVKPGNPLPDFPLSPSPLKAIPFSLLLDLSPSPEKASSDSDDVTSGPMTLDDVTSEEIGAVRKHSSASNGLAKEESPILKGPAGCGSPMRPSRGSVCQKKRVGFSGGTLKGPRMSWGAAYAVPGETEGPQTLRGLQPGANSVKGILKRRSSLSGDSVPQSRGVTSPESVSRRVEEALAAASLEGKALEGAGKTLAAVSMLEDKQSLELDPSPEGVPRAEAHQQVSSQKKAVRFADESGQGELCHYQCW